VNPLARKVVRRYLADLHPPLGDPGGPCQVIRRIHEEIRSPRLEDQLTEEVEKGEDLSNPEAAKVYQIDRELGVNFVRNILIGPHAQYRMDLRSVTVKDVQQALAGFNKMLNTLRSKKSPAAEGYQRQLARGEPIKWIDPKTNLTVVFAMESRDTLKVVTTYWPGVETPKIPAQGCPVTKAPSAS
jgi:hypothetical protein